MRENDPLMSAQQVARLYGTGINTVIKLVAEGHLPTLDKGKLVAAGRLDLPLIRRSWARSLQTPSDGAARIIQPPDGVEMHPAVAKALDFHSALAQRDPEAIASLSSAASSHGRTSAELLARWLEVTSGGFPDTSGVGSALYSLAPLSAVAARVIADAPSIPRATDRPTPALLVAVLPLVTENEDWKVDLPLFEDQQRLISLLGQPPPAEPTSDSAPPPANAPSITRSRRAR